MKKLLIILMFLPLWMDAGLPARPSSDIGVQFFKGTLDAAKEKARREGKLIFVDFYASWCSPCRLMDDYTFPDNSLADYMSDKYIPVKVDIDDFDGFGLKQQYHINLLPTLLIMDCNGKEIERKQESMMPSNMKTFLREHYQAYNLCDIPTSAPIASTAPVQPSTPTVSKPEPMKPIISKPSLPPSRPKPTPASPPALIEPVAPERPQVPQVPQVPQTPSVPSTHANPALEDGLFRFSVQRQSSKGFSVQTGAFGQYGNVLREVDKLQRLFPDQPIIVYISTLNHRTVYKVLVGEFQTKIEAIDQRGRMADKGFPGLVKDLAFMQ